MGRGDRGRTRAGNDPLGPRALRQFLSLFALAFAAVAATSLGLRVRQGKPAPPRSQTAVPRRGPPIGNPTLIALGEAHRAGDAREEERIVDGALAGPLGRPDAREGLAVELHAAKAQLLARRGADASALAEYRRLLRGDYDPRGRPWVASVPDLEPALDLALRSGKPNAIDEVATRIAGEPGPSLADFPELNTVAPGATPQRRLAHALLVLSSYHRGNRDHAGAFRLCVRAAGLAPNEVPVLIQLAEAYRSRNEAGDRQKAEAAFRRAYLLLPANSTARFDLRIVGNGSGIDPAGPNAKPSLEEVLREWSVEGPRRMKAQIAAREAARARYQADEAAREAAVRARMRSGPASP